VEREYADVTGHIRSCVAIIAWIHKVAFANQACHQKDSISMAANSGRVCQHDPIIFPRNEI
jgi:hypothetical protein